MLKQNRTDDSNGNISERNSVYLNYAIRWVKQPIRPHWYISQNQSTSVTYDVIMNHHSNSKSVPAVSLFSVPLETTTMTISIFVYYYIHTLHYCTSYFLLYMLYIFHIFLSFFHDELIETEFAQKPVNCKHP